ncbi:MAG: hypothetical protein QW208_02000 [Acidilobaceae archaeon]
MVLDVVRRVFGLGTKAKSLNEGVDFDEVMAKLQIAKMEVDRVKNQLIDEINRFYDKMIEAAKNKDNDTLELTATEIVLKKKVLTSILTYSKLLTLAIQRLDDARNIDTLVKVLAPLEYVMRATDDYIATISPETALKLSSLLEATERVIRGVEMTASYMPSARIIELDPEARQEIARVVAEANRESEMIVKTPSRLEDSLEEKLLEYIRSRGGSISISIAARELNVKPEDIWRTLEKLEDKGLVKIYRRQAEASTA